MVSDTLKPYRAKAIANWFIDRAAHEGESIDPMKLQKLVYFAHGWSLGLRDQPLLDELPQAWAFGPVIPSIYHEFKSFGPNPIRRRAREYDDETAELRDVPPPQSGEIYILLSWVWEKYGHESSSKLSAITHRDGGPWATARQNAKEKHGYLPRNYTIDNDLVAQHFKKLYKDLRERGSSKRAR